MMTRIAIVDDKPSIRNLVRNKLGSDRELAIVFEACNGAEFLEMAAKTDVDKLPQIVLMDIEMPVMNGIDAIGIGSALYPQIRFVVLTVFDDDEKIFEAIKAGAAGYLLKDEAKEVIRKVITDMLEMTGSPMSPSIARKALALLNRAVLPGKPQSSGGETLGLLTGREREILSLQVEGLDYREIGEKLCISHNTVRTHICNIYEKLHVTSKAQAVNIAVRYGIR